jgi:hypothetical protein
MRNDDAAREWANGIFFFERKNLAERGEILGWVGSEGGAREQYNSNSLIKEISNNICRFEVGT